MLLFGLLDDLDKELNNYAMRLKEWYGWHFPEMTKILTDGLVYAKAVRVMGISTSSKTQIKSNRDWQLELKLIERIVPKDAEDIHNAADMEAQKARVQS